MLLEAIIVKTKSEAAPAKTDTSCSMQMREVVSEFPAAPADIPWAKEKIKQ